MPAKVTRSIPSREGDFLGLFHIFFFAAFACGCWDASPVPKLNTDGAVVPGSGQHSLKSGPSDLAKDLSGNKAVDTIAEQNLFQVPLGKSPRSGPDDAKVTAVLFGDFADNDTARIFGLLIERQKHDGSFRWVYKFYPHGALDGPAMDACIAARYAADMGKFSNFALAVFSLGGKISRRSLGDIASRLGLDRNSMLAALNDESLKKLVLADRRLAARLAVKRAPFVFLNGRPLHFNSPKDFEKQFPNALDAELHRAALLLEKGISGKRIYLTLTQHGRRSAWMKKIDLARPRRQRGTSHTYYSGDSREKTFFVTPGHGPHLGPNKPEIGIVAFVSATCSFCGGTLIALKKIVQKYPNKVGVWVRHVPDSKKRPGPILAAVFLQALSSEPEYWDLAPKIMGGKVKLNIKSLLEYVRQTGFDISSLKKKLAHREKLEKQLKQNRTEAERLGVHSSPFLFVNGKPLMGATNRNRLERMIEDEPTTSDFTATQ